jgi:hypothetical protein
MNFGIVVQKWHLSDQFNKLPFYIGLNFNLSEVQTESYQVCWSGLAYEIY